MSLVAQAKGGSRFPPAVLQFSLAFLLIREPMQYLAPNVGRKFERTRRGSSQSILNSWRTFSRNIECFTYYRLPQGRRRSQDKRALFFRKCSAILQFYILPCRADKCGQAGRKIPTASNCSPAPFLPRLAALTRVKGFILFGR